jgi:Peptidase A4 family
MLRAMSPSARSRRRLASLLAAAGAGTVLAPAVARASTDVSSNWAGYVALATHGGRFATVSGTWVVPSATCTRGRQYSAMWVGLGGDSETAGSLEQVGTEADCGAGGKPAYAAWFEILPAGPVAVPFKVRPGDTVVASSTVAGHLVTLRIRDLTTASRFSTTRRASATDVSSAEWIVEAPSSCSGASCTALPLADFGTAAFLGASARLTGARGASSSIQELELQQESLSAGVRDAASGSGPDRDLVTAAPSPRAARTGAFTVTWSEQTTQLPVPTPPTLPGFGGG